MQTHIRYRNQSNGRVLSHVVEGIPTLLHGTAMLIARRIRLCAIFWIVPWAPACLAWSRLHKHLAPFLQWSLTGGVLGIQWKDNMLRQAASQRYCDHKRWANQMLYDYYSGKWWKSKPLNVQARLVMQENILGKWYGIWEYHSYNRRKLDELPFHYFHLNSDLEGSKYLSDVLWIYDKVCGSNCYQLLEDIKLQGGIRNEFTHVLKDFLETHASVLNYDGRQFYSHLYKFLEDKLTIHELSLGNDSSSLSKVYSITKNPPVRSLIPLNCAAMEPGGDTDENAYREKTFNLIIRLPRTNKFIVTVSTDKEEICVWDVISFLTCNHEDGE
ncbi:hypothetical protein NQ318_004157 [Aromia moschata]|uniref:Uncharacterized protein n=1 Tax=Aromia moschata TaxID=1265417 RepID=A0AAV8YLS8_9CUCU|nr:hypothetical protein NQ318_004157 [Aromia moschata]